jgi:hypothetical protein
VKAIPAVEYCIETGRMLSGSYSLQAIAFENVM